MATKNIKKILLNKDGNKFVVDTENIVRSVNGVNADENGNVSITSVTNANHATTADSATNATNADNATNLGGYPASDYVRSVNGVHASENGNVTIPLPFVKTVNSTAPDSNGNVVLDLSSSGGVGLPDLNAGVAISNFNGTHTSNTTKTYTLPSNGWVMGSLIFQGYNGGCTVSIYLNNTLQKSFSPANKTVDYDFYMPLKSGTQIKIQFQYSGSATTVSSSLKFYPFLS